MKEPCKLRLVKAAMLLLFVLCLFSCTRPASPYTQLYPQLFPLEQVRLGDGPMRSAMNLNDSILLQYDVDRLLTPFCRQAGVEGWEEKYPNFSNWGSGSFRLDGHLGGHYLSALALAYAASDDETTRAAMLQRLNHMVDVLDECQRKFDDNTEGLFGYIGGLPDNSVWTRMHSGDLSGFEQNRGNVPLYVQHKVFAGLRDAYIYAGNKKAFECLKKLCDWGINLVYKFGEEEMQHILDTEHGGINEIYADMFRLTGETKYMDAARKYSHKKMLCGMQTPSAAFLDGKHANTQVPKYIGFARIGQEGEEEYLNAARNFWEDVALHRTTCIGGNSVDEHFLSKENSENYITHANGPESCNTNNMLKLTERLFEEEHSARYADFYENALLNHILSSQNPRTGGYVYFTSLRPQHYRVYSRVNEAMWCCVGTGMENHSKYGEFIYTHSAEGRDTVFVNLFIDSELNNSKFHLRQTTRFSYGKESELTILKGGRFALCVRHPEWAGEGFSLSINGKELSSSSESKGCATIERRWRKGDVVRVSLPMELSAEPCPNVQGYISIKYGPVLLGAETAGVAEDNYFAGEGRMDHCPSNGALLDLNSAPAFTCSSEEALAAVRCIDPSKLHFRVNPESCKNGLDTLTLKPFYTIHESRYEVYFPVGVR